MSRVVHKLKEWLQLKPQFEITSQDGPKINSVVRISDGVEFSFGEIVGDVKIAGFFEDCIHLYVFVTTKAEEGATGIKGRKITMTTRIKKIEINDLTFIPENISTECITYNI